MIERLKELFSLETHVRKRPIRHIQVITSCTGLKAIHHERQLSYHDFQRGLDWIRHREAGLETLPAERMYQGGQHRKLMEGVDSARSDFEISVKVVSAGYGLVDGETPIAPYETTFNSLSLEQVRQHGRALELPVEIVKALDSHTT